VVHAPIGGCPLPGWLVVAPRRHVEALTELSPSERAELFALGGRLDQLLREVLGAQKVYLAIFAEVVAHTHLHVIPRFADTPADLRGPRCFLATPDRHLAADQVAATIAQLRRHLAVD
jgi:diadenosine tetraphosphate (Ap4A) HIT family hydrolase